MIKMVKDWLIRALWGKNVIPRGLFDLGQYFRGFGPIVFRHEKGEDGSIIAISTNFRYGSIVTSGRDEKELDKNIKDAILTSFKVPSSYAKEAKIIRTDEKKKEYALA
ncbi:MAG: hypothetical protein PHT44_01715 [Candidatus Portnoybacteria bacterium]|nr:hypothetical protein [Candidatus Portnoybacteria bacterium]MDD4982687.1 hypothetical protein [Candidatus Portnoybacteria bacterium]